MSSAMSRSRIGIAVLIMATALSSATPARSLHLGFGSILGGMRSAVSHLLPRGHHRRSSDPVRLAHAMNAVPRADELRSGGWFNNPAARGQITAAAALAGWHGGNGASGWWRHGDGGYGWVGPLFWPFAYYDIYDYTIWGDGVGFFGYGYGDLFAGIFAPYRYDDLDRYLAPSRGRRHERIPSLAEMCGDGRDEVAGLPIDLIKQAIQPNEEQRAALDDLANGSVQAAQTIRSACPTEVVLTASGRLAEMQRRVEAMISAVGAMRRALEKLYDLLDDEQKARLGALAGDQGKNPSSAASPAQGCGKTRPAAFQWPGDELAARVRLNDTQRAAFAVLRDKSAKAKDMLKDDCQPDDLTPPARLAAIDTRLDAMHEAIKLVRPALEDFYATLSDEQKAQFEAIGPRRTG